MRGPWPYSMLDHGDGDLLQHWWRATCYPGSVVTLAVESEFRTNVMKEPAFFNYYNWRWLQLGWKGCKNALITSVLSYVPYECGHLSVVSHGIASEH